MSESLGKCAVCGEDAGAVYPLLPGSPAFCASHHNPKDAEPFGCDFSGPDDFDIPDEWCPVVFHGNREAFIWKDRGGNKHKLKDIDDNYIQNIISFLRRRLEKMDIHSATYWSEVIVFLEKEQMIRNKVGGANDRK